MGADVFAQCLARSLGELQGSILFSLCSQVTDFNTKPFSHRLLDFGVVARSNLSNLGQVIGHSSPIGGSDALPAGPLEGSVAEFVAPS